MRKRRMYQFEDPLSAWRVTVAESDVKGAVDLIFELNDGSERARATLSHETWDEMFTVTKGTYSYSDKFDWNSPSEEPEV